ncbi:VOC family protein [Alteromonas sp. H39]|uniref:VOC family protein n=1 Tax=Alteromonas sp. H39 TaxID=3389876 RepID=UPI0039E11316
MENAMWLDMTVDDADTVSEFYAAVMGWRRETVDMGNYVDFVMIKPDGSPAGGICHRRGPNAALPSGWIPYFTVAELASSINAVVAKGGEQVGEIRTFGDAEYCLIKDPGGNHCALYASSKPVA